MLQYGGGDTSASDEAAGWGGCGVSGGAEGCSAAEGSGGSSSL